MNGYRMQHEEEKEGAAQKWDLSKNVTTVIHIV